MKVKVKTVTLIERVAASRERLLRAHDATVERALAAEPAYREHVAATLEAALENVRRGGELPGEHVQHVRGPRRYLLVPIKGRKRPPSIGPVHVGAHDKRLAELRLETRPELVIDPSGSDWRGLL